MLPVLTLIRRCIAQKPHNRCGLQQPTLLLLRRQSPLVFYEQGAEFEQSRFNRFWIDAVSERPENLRGNETIQIFDSGQMGKSISAGEFDRTRQAVQPLLKLGYGFSRLMKSH